MSISISICMPVYNCAAYVGQALDSILPQAGEGVEIVPADPGRHGGGHSTVSKAFPCALPRIRPRRIDADLATCVSPPMASTAGLSW
jgi:hypothetical protein